MKNLVATALAAIVSMAPQPVVAQDCSHPAECLCRAQRVVYDGTVVAVGSERAELRIDFVELAAGASAAPLALGDVVEMSRHNDQGAVVAVGDRLLVTGHETEPFVHDEGVPVGADEHVTCSRQEDVVLDVEEARHAMVSAFEDCRSMLEARGLDEDAHCDDPDGCSMAGTNSGRVPVALALLFGLALVRRSRWRQSRQ